MAVHHRGRRLRQTVALTSIYLVAYLLLAQAKMFKAASAVSRRIQSSRITRVAGKLVLVPKRGLRACANARRYASTASVPRPSSLIRLLKWALPLPLTAAGYVALKQWQKKQNEGLTEEEVKLQPGPMSLALTFLPTRSMSRLWGVVNELPLPLWARGPVLGLYSKVFHCNLAEAEDPVLEHYANLQSFFMRKLVPNARPSASAPLVSPADCRVMNFGQVEGDEVKQVKGITYSLKSFLGEKAEAKPGNSLFHIVLYLAPGDYHHFHSPASWTATLRRHFPGALLSVSPFAMSRIKGLLALNERVVLKGSWEHGLFTYTAVGAYNVGSITIDADPSLHTNVRARISAKPIALEGPLLKDVVSFDKGDRVGSFRLGSTIVLVFEAPSDFEFTVEPGQKLMVGQAIGRLGNSASTSTNTSEETATATTSTAQAATVSAAA